MRRQIRGIPGSPLTINPQAQVRQGLAHSLDPITVPVDGEDGYARRRAHVTPLSSHCDGFPRYSAPAIDLVRKGRPAEFGGGSHLYAGRGSRTGMLACRQSRADPEMAGFRLKKGLTPQPHVPEKRSGRRGEVDQWGLKRGRGWCVGPVWWRNRAPTVKLFPGPKWYSRPNSVFFLFFLILFSVFICP